jgi:hypothetical protein
MRPLLTLALLALGPTAVLAFSEYPLPRLTLRGGEGAIVPDTGLTLLVTKITDERCPYEPNMACVWEGMVRAEITVLGPRPEMYQIVLCNLCDDGAQTTTAAGLTLTYIGLAPSTEELAKLGRAPLLTDYELTVAYGPAPN